MAKLPTSRARRARALAAGEITYEGDPCRHGHSGIRDVSHDTCVACRSIENARYHKRAKKRRAAGKRKPITIPPPPVPMPVLPMVAAAPRSTSWWAAIKRRVLSDRSEA